MYDEQIKWLRDRAGAFDYDGRPDIACDYEQAADTIEELNIMIDSYKRIMKEWIQEAYRAYSKYAKSVFDSLSEEN